MRIEKGKAPNYMAFHLLWVALCWITFAATGLAYAQGSADQQPMEAATGAYDGSTRVLNRGATLTAGLMHSCAVLADGRVQCWRDNSSVPVTVSGITNAVAVAARCAVLADGHVQCWDSKSLVPVTVSGITDAVAVAGSCAVLADGRVQCWRDESFVPVTVNGITNAIAVAGEYGYYCTVLADGKVQCWGVNSSAPVTISGITNAVAVSRGGAHTCVVLADGRVQCWGRNPQGELGNGTTSDSSVPVTVSGITNAVAVAASTCNYTCAVLADGRAQCWGHILHFATSLNKRKGNDGTGNSLIPVTVSGITNAVAVAAQDMHPCALLADGRVQCWGFIYRGELGNGTKSTASAPVTVNGLAEHVRASAGTAQ